MPILAKRTLASTSWPGSLPSTIWVSGRMTSPAYSAKRPPRPTLTEPRRSRGERRIIAGIEHHGALVLMCEDLIDRERRDPRVVTEEIADLSVPVCPRTRSTTAPPIGPG